ncbi:hypothetical protein CTAYLR_001379 [Chrysophaeum taylorii]|uniref:Ion transport domain-containing protein n=1 Tax=Chrysophaeum taylorii TaxID=2483200 RepID=A0AAD7U638_9STRA|nr:hypothetical protein CTAYLR_001379 [Chrysophaeum taylorii]
MGPPTPKTKKKSLQKVEIRDPVTMVRTSLSRTTLGRRVNLKRQNSGGSDSEATTRSIASTQGHEDDDFMNVFADEGFESARERRFDGEVPSFPRHERKTWTAYVFDPTSLDHLAWDFLMLFLVGIVLFAAPYEFAFVSKTPRGGGLHVLNHVVTTCFIVDIAVTLNTALYDLDESRWILDRFTIFKRYAQLWLWIDVISIIPWQDLPLGEHFRLLKLVRLVRLFKLLKIVKAPQILESLDRVFSISYKTSLMIKYVVILISLLHLEACMFRYAHDLVKSGRKNLDAGTVLSTPDYVLYEPHFRAGGNFAIYVDCLDWGMQTLLGQSVYRNTTEGVLSLVNNLVGVMFFSFLIGDLANILCNLDPASNEYKQTVDSLNNFMRLQHFPESVRDKMRTYLANAEPMFRANFEDELMSKLSPNLQELVAHFMLGKKVAITPFFSYARQRALGLNCGRRLYIKPRRWHLYEDAGVAQAKEAVIVLLRSNMRYDVKYRETGKIEKFVSHSRISMAHEADDMQRAIQKMEGVSKLIVTQLASCMRMILILARESVIRKSLTINDKMYLVEKGAIYTFGRDVTSPFRIEKVGPTACIGDREIAFHVAGHPPMPCWYNARATEMTRCLVLRADHFVQCLNQPGYDSFRRYIARFGVWAHFKMQFYTAIKTGFIVDPVLREWKLKDHDVRPPSPPKKKDGDDGALADRVGRVERLLSKVASRLGVDQPIRDDGSYPSKEGGGKPSRASSDPQRARKPTASLDTDPRYPSINQPIHNNGGGGSALKEAGGKLLAKPSRTSSEPPRARKSAALLYEPRQGGPPRDRQGCDYVRLSSPPDRGDEDDDEDDAAAEIRHRSSFNLPQPASISLPRSSTSPRPVLGSNPGSAKVRKPYSPARKYSHKTSSVDSMLRF